MTHRPYTYCKTTVSVCPECYRALPGKFVEQAGKIYLQKFCPEHGHFKSLISTDRELFLAESQQVRAGALPQQFSAPVQQGCPSDCGLCSDHEQRCAIPVIEINNRCDWNCPVCFAHNNDNYQMTTAEFEQCLDTIARCENNQVDMLVISGGEPTGHPQFYELMQRCLARNLPLVVVNTNGKRLAQDDEFAAFCASHGLHLSLQLDSFRSQVYERLRGFDCMAIKEQALAMAQKHQVQLNIIQTVVKGINEDEVGVMAQFAMKHELIRSLNIHLMTYTGKNGRHFPKDPWNVLTGPDILARLEEQTGGLFLPSDFLPMPFIHPRCALITYAIVQGSQIFPIPRFMPHDRYLPLLEQGAIAKADGSFEQALAQTIHELWASSDPYHQKLLTVLNQMFHELFPKEKKLSSQELQRVSSKYVKTLFIHNYMDEDSLDVDRLRRCCAMQVMPDGRMIPNCAYFVLHRRHDPRFFPNR